MAILCKVLHRKNSGSAAAPLKYSTKRIVTGLDNQLKVIKPRFSCGLCGG